jgi:predicted nuclease of predicted toxin-antitoxin system
LEDQRLMDINLDENLSRHLKKLLRLKGHNSLTAADENLLGRSDLDVGQAARTEGKMLFTLDVEFADLRKYSAGDHPGVVLFRPQSMGPLTVNDLVLEFVSSVDLSGFRGCVVIVEPTRVRVRRPSSSDADSLE